MKYLSCVILIFTAVSHVFTSPAYPASLSLSALSTSTNSKQGNTSLGDTPPECNATKYGGNVRWQSSHNALAKLSEDPTPKRFKMREPGGEEPGGNVLLPLRIISDDGKDFIEVATKNNLEVADVASWRIIRSVANSIIQTCVSQPIPQGGTVTDTGFEGLLTVTVSSYDNNKIVCINPARVQIEAPQYESCKSILDIMPWSERQNPFGDTPSPLGPTILLPAAYPSIGGQCVLNVQITLGYDYASFKSLWAAGVAALEMCIKQGQLGFAFALGDAQKISLNFGKPMRQVGSLGSPRLNLTSGTTRNNLTSYRG